MTATNPLTNVIEWGDISVTPGIKLWLKAYKIAIGAAHIIKDVIKNLLTTPAIVVVNLGKKRRRSRIIAELDTTPGKRKVAPRDLTQRYK